MNEGTNFNVDFSGVERALNLVLKQAIEDQDSLTLAGILDELLMSFTQDRRGGEYRCSMTERMYCCYRHKLDVIRNPEVFRSREDSAK